MCTDELTRMNKNFGSGAYGSLPVCQMQPTVIDITAGFYYQPAVIVYITVGLLENPVVIAIFSYELIVMHLLVSVLKFR